MLHFPLQLLLFDLFLTPMGNRLVFCWDTHIPGDCSPEEGNMRTVERVSISDITGCQDPNF